jgi:hypothetical protein
MTDSATSRRQRERRHRRVVVMIVTAGLLLGAMVLASNYGPAYIAYAKYEPREGDLLFQPLPRSPYVNMIEGVTESSFSHCGIVARENDEWVVYEASGYAEPTPLREFVFRGRDFAFAVYRLKSEHQRHVPELLNNVRSLAGRPYDTHFKMDDERIYCSELIYKAYRAATGGEELGRLARLRDLPWKPWESAIVRFEGGPVPLDREMITPKNLAEADQLELVYSYRLGSIHE